MILFLRLEAKSFKMDLDMFNTNVCDLINNNVKKVIAVGVSISNTNTKVPLSNTNSNANISKDKTKVSMLSVLKDPLNKS